MDLTNFWLPWQIVSLWSTRAEIFVGAVLFFFVGIYIIYKVVIRRGKKIVFFFISVTKSVAEAVAANPEVKKITKKHPRFFHELKKRVTFAHFSGMPLTILFLLFIYSLGIFFGIAEDLARQQPTFGVDIRLANLLVFFRNPVLVTFFLWITVLGKWQIVVLFLFMALVVIWRHGQRHYAIPLLVTVAGSQAMVIISKLALHRPRPTGLIPAYVEPSFSFPSGHATIAVAFYGFLMYYAWRHLKRWRWKVNTLFLGIILIAAIGFSRLYLGVHFLSDVVSGYVVGLLWLIVGVSTIEWRRQRSLVKVTDHPLPKAWYSLGGLAIIGYLAFAVWYVPTVDRLSPNNFTPTDTVTADQIIQSFDIYGLPRFTETLRGNPQEPPSFIILARDDTQLIATFGTAGWQLADPLDARSLYDMSKAIMLKDPYPKAPITPAFWYNSVHDFGFEKSTTLNLVTERHHARVWKTSLQTPDGQHVYLATASFDTSFKWLVTHRIEPAIDTERDHLLNDLETTGQAKLLQETQFVPPTLGKNFTGDQFFTDGKIYIIQLP